MHNAARLNIWILATVLIGLPSSMSFAKSVASKPVAPWATFKSWDKQKQAVYFSNLRKAYTEFENSVNEDLEFAERAPLRNIFSLIPYAHAADVGYCMVGGVSRVTVDDGEKVVCPTYGRGCSQLRDGFLCGTIYGSVCVDRQPINSISDRCEQNAKIPDQAGYEKARQDIQIVLDRCANDGVAIKFRPKCAKFTEQVRKLDNQFGAQDPAPPSAEPVKTSSQKTEARGIKVATDDIDVNPDDQPAKAVEFEEVAEAVPEAPKKVEPKSNNVPPKNSKKLKPTVATGKDCISRNRASLGHLACVACALEESSPAEIANQDGVSNWISLLGIVAQRHHDPRSKDEQAQQVAEMVASYGYCTNADYPIHPGKEARDWMDGKKIDSAKFAKTYGLNSDKSKYLLSEPEDKSQPARFFDAIFGDIDWKKGNAQNRQWRFQSLINSHAKSYPKTAFSKCARSVNENLKKKPFQMCVKKNGKMPKTANFAANDELYQKMAGACGFSKQRKVASQACYNECIKNGTYVRTNFNSGNGCNDRGRDGGNDRTTRGTDRTTRGTKGDEVRGAPRGNDPDDPGDPGKDGEEGGTPRGDGYDGNASPQSKGGGQGGKGGSGKSGGGSQGHKG